jgi:hypothetical protein
VHSFLQIYQEGMKAGRNLDAVPSFLISLDITQDSHDFLDRGSNCAWWSAFAKATPKAFASTAA